MAKQEYLRKMLDEQETERQHQLNFIAQLKRMYGELDRKGFGPLNVLFRQITTWEQNLSIVEKQIGELERIFEEESVSE